jgi:hypothetical protein
MSLARSCFVNRKRNVKFEVQAEFYNVFNRLFLFHSRARQAQWWRRNIGGRQSRRAYD